MAGKLYYSKGDPDLLALLVVWEAEESAALYELIEGGRLLGMEWALFETILGRCPNHPLKSGRGVVLELESGERIFSISEICRLACERERESGLSLKGPPEHQARVDYWLDWGCGQLKVCVEFNVH